MEIRDLHQCAGVIEENPIRTQERRTYRYALQYYNIENSDRVSRRPQSSCRPAPATGYFAKSIMVIGAKKVLSGLGTKTILKRIRKKKEKKPKCGSPITGERASGRRHVT